MTREDHKKYAIGHGYFWMPCPICGTEFGGHEAGEAALWHDPGWGTAVCPKRSCQFWGRASAKRHNRDFVI